MRYIDSGLREAEQTVAFWMQEAIDAGIDEFRCQTGYFTLDGVGLLLPALKTCAAKGAVVQLLLGSNGGATLASHIGFLAGTLGVPQANVSIGIVGFDTSLFHPKVYHLTRKNGSKTAYIGSSNLTGPGISGKNIEAGIILDTEDGDQTEILDDISDRIEYWFTQKSPGMYPISGPQEIDELLASGKLALKPLAQPVELGEEANSTEGKRLKFGSRLQAIYKIPEIKGEDYLGTKIKPLRVPGPADSEKYRKFVRHTEASFHYPQGTHLGHIISILWHFSQPRAGTAFDDNYIRLNGSLGSGRIAAYRRQIKYKILAAIELGLINDIRLTDDIVSYTPELTAAGQKLWTLIAPHVNYSDLEFKIDEGDHSTAMPKAPKFYNKILSDAQKKSEELNMLYKAAFLSMPAVEQMLKFLYFQERTSVVSKARIYENFFQSEAVQIFCDTMGIEPATQEAARHRCPFLLNVLESCDVLSQGTFDVTIDRLALSPELITSISPDQASAEQIVDTVTAEWRFENSSLSPKIQEGLRNLFGSSFLTNNYHINQILRVPG